jgi:hypothetical protein
MVHAKDCHCVDCRLRLARLLAVVAIVTAGAAVVVLLLT